MSKKLLAIDWASDELPMLPSIAYRLMSVIDSNKGNLTELSSIISQDPTLALKVLQVTNSAFYALGMEVTSIKHAIVLLGFKEVKRIAIGTVIANRFLTVASDVRPQAEALWRHMLATAVLAQDLVQGIDEDPDLYTLGLLHDIGWLILLAQAPKVFKSLIQERDYTRDELESLWDVDHQLWGAKLAEKWGLPEPFQVVAYRHHSPFIDFHPPKYLVTITLANYLANSTGIKILNGPQENIDDVLEYLSINKETMKEMEAAAIGECDRIDEFCKILCS